MAAARRRIESRRAATSGVSAPGADGGSDEERAAGGALDRARARSEDGGVDEGRGELGGRSDGGTSAARDASFTRASGTLPVVDEGARRRPVSVSFCTPTGAADSAP